MAVTAFSQVGCRGGGGGGSNKGRQRATVPRTPRKQDYLGSPRPLPWPGLATAGLSTPGSRSCIFSRRGQGYFSQPRHRARPPLLLLPQICNRPVAKGRGQILLHTRNQHPEIDDHSHTGGRHLQCHRGRGRRPVRCKKSKDGGGWSTDLACKTSWVLLSPVSPAQRFSDGGDWQS